MSTVGPADIAALKKAGTAVIADVYDNQGEVPKVLSNDLLPTRGPGVAFAGPAYTVEGHPHSGPHQPDLDKLKAIDEMTPGVVALWAGNGMAGVCAFGDLLSAAMKCRGIAGVVVDGGIRDMAFIRDLDLPIMVRYRTPAQAIGRWKVTACQQPVEVQGALTAKLTIAPGDIIVADDDGVITIPADQAPHFATLAATWETKDQAAREDILKGMKLLAAREKHGAL